MFSRRFTCCWLTSVAVLHFTTDRIRDHSHCWPVSELQRIKQTHVNDLQEDKTYQNLQRKTLFTHKHTHLTLWASSLRKCVVQCAGALEWISLYRGPFSGFLSCSVCEVREKWAEAGTLFWRWRTGGRGAFWGSDKKVVEGIYRITSCFFGCVSLGQSTRTVKV